MSDTTLQNYAERDNIVVSEASPTYVQAEAGLLPAQAEAQVGLDEDAAARDAADADTDDSSEDN